MIPRIKLGNTGLSVSRLCFGTGPLGILRYNFSAEVGAQFLHYAHSLGVNFLDTANNYGTFSHIHTALKSIRRENLVICSKIGFKDVKQVREALELCFKSINTDYIDIMMTHGVRDIEDLESRDEMLDELCRWKSRGAIRAVGASTHIYTGPIMPALIDDPRIEVILTYYNKTGVGLIGGSIEEHYQHIQRAHSAGKGLMAMKVLCEGYYYRDAVEHLQQVFSIPEIHSVDLGIINKEQVTLVDKLLNHESIDDELIRAARQDVDRDWALNFPNSYS